MSSAQQQSQQPTTHNQTTVDPSRPVPQVVQPSEDPLVKQLEAAVDNGNVQVIHALYNEHKQQGTLSVLEAAVNTPCKAMQSDAEDFMSPLQYACRDGQYEIAKALMDYGLARVNARTPKNLVTCTMFATYKAHFNIVKCLVEHGADVNIQDADGVCALHDVAESNETGICSLLIEHGANVNLLDNEHFSPLYLAAQNGKVDIVRLFLQAGALVDTPSMLFVHKKLYPLFIKY